MAGIINFSVEATCRSLFYQKVIGMFYSKRPVASPNANPSKIGKGNPGNIPFFSNIKSVMMEPASMPIIAAKVGIILGIKVKNMVPVNIE